MRWCEWFASTLCWRGCSHLYGLILSAVEQGPGTRTWKAQGQGGLNCLLSLRGHRQTLGPSPEQAPQSLSRWQGCSASMQTLAMGNQTAVGWWGWCGPPDNFDSGDCKMAGALNRTRAEYYLYYVEEARNMGKISLFFFFHSTHAERKKYIYLTWKHFFT